MRWWALLVALLALSARAEETVVLLGPGGAEVSLRPTGDEVLLLHFWATWCPTCAEDLAHLQHAAAACSEGSVRVIAVNVGEAEPEVAEFVQRSHLELAVLRDPSGAVWREVDGRGLPTNLFWTRERRWTEVGPRSEAVWREALRGLGCGTGAEPGGDDPDP